MANLVGIAGSLRKASYNSALLRACQGALPSGSSLDILDIAGVPLYDGDVEDADGIPSAVTSLKDAVAAADGLIIVTPEYNAGIPGVLKNVIDWMSRPPRDAGRVFYGRPVALMGATPGRLGTALAQTAWLGVLRALRMSLWLDRGMYLLPAAAEAFDDDGMLQDDDVEERVRSYLAGFVAYVERLG